MECVCVFHWATVEFPQRTLKSSGKSLCLGLCVIHHWLYYKHSSKINLKGCERVNLDGDKKQKEKLLLFWQTWNNFTCLTWIISVRTGVYMKGRTFLNHDYNLRGAGILIYCDIVSKMIYCDIFWFFSNLVCFRYMLFVWCFLFHPYFHWLGPMCH